MLVPRLPYQPPRWLTAERIAVAAVAVIPLACMAQWLLMEAWRRPGTSMVLVAGLVGGLACITRWALRADRSSQALARVCLSAFMFAISFELFMTASGDRGCLRGSPDPLSVLFFSLCVCVLIVPPVAIILLDRRRPSHDGPVRALRGIGLWLVCLSVVLLLAFERLPPFWVSMAVGGAMVAAALVWLGLRARFISRLRAGRAMLGAPAVAAPAAASLSALPLPSGPLSHDGARPYLEEGVLPYQRGGADAAYELLVWNPPPGGDGAYRDLTQPVPMALVPVPNQRRKTADDVSC